MTDETGQGNSNVFTQLITMTIKPEREADFLETARRAIELVEANESWTSLYVLTRHPDRPHTYVWLERYADEAASQKHGNMSYMPELLASVRECVSGVERLVLEQTLPA